MTIMDQGSIIETTDCAICLNILQETNRTILRCGHQFCTECIFTSMRRSNNCPLCRQNIIEEGRHRDEERIHQENNYVTITNSLVEQENNYINIINNALDISENTPPTYENTNINNYNYNDLHDRLYNNESNVQENLDNESNVQENLDWAANILTSINRNADNIQNMIQYVINEMQITNTNMGRNEIHSLFIRNLHNVMYSNENRMS